MPTHITQGDLIESVAAALQYISYYHPVDYIQRKSSPTRACAPRATARSARTPASSMCS
jgi:tartrate dehydratase alpha subunit/fumarate hydratase class I-like protein